MAKYKIILLVFFVCESTYGSEYVVLLENKPGLSTDYNGSNYTSMGIVNLVKIDGLNNTPLAAKAVGLFLGFSVGAAVGSQMLVTISKCKDRPNDVTCFQEKLLGMAIGGTVGAFYGLKVVALPFRKTIQVSASF